MHRRQHARHKSEHRLGASPHQRRRPEHEERHVSLRGEREIEERKGDQPLTGGGLHPAGRQANQEKVLAWVSWGAGKPVTLDQPSEVP